MTESGQNHLVLLLDSSCCIQCPAFSSYHVLPHLLCVKQEMLTLMDGLCVLSFTRYDAKTNELINEELGIAYPIVDGIPNMIPQEARLIKKETSNTPSQ